MHFCFGNLDTANQKVHNGQHGNRRRPKGQPDGRRPKGQLTWVQAWTQTLYELGNGSLRGCVAVVVGECVNQRRRIIVGPRGPYLRF